MRRLKTWALAAMGIFCLGLSALALVIPDAPVEQVAMIAPFGVALLATAAAQGYRPAARGALGAPGTIDVGGAPVPALVMGLSRRRRWLSVVGTAAMGVAGIAVALNGRAVLGAVAGALFLGAAVVIGVMTARDRTSLALSEHGIHLRAAGAVRTLGWDDDLTTRRSTVGSWEFLSVSGADRELKIPLTSLKADPDAVVALIERLIAEPAARGELAAGDYARSL
jgi:hypothetical protein